MTNTTPNQTPAAPASTPATPAAPRREYHRPTLSYIGAISHLTQGVFDEEINY